MGHPFLRWLSISNVPWVDLIIQTGKNSLTFHIAKFLDGEGNVTPLQHSCLENPMDAAAWWVAVHGVAKSRTRLSDFLSLFTVMHWRRKWQPTPVFLPGESQGRGAWWAAISGVAQSRTRLKRLSSSSSKFLEDPCFYLPTYIFWL